MSSLLHQTLSGLAIGGIYACLALSLVMIHQTTHLLNFAQGEMAMLSTFFAWTLLQAHVPYWAAFLITMAVSLLIGVALQELFLRRFVQPTVFVMTMVFVGLLVLLNSLAGWLYGYTIKTFPSPFPPGSVIAGGYLSYHELGSIGVCLAVLAVLFVFFKFTRLGLMLRAAAENPESARLSGIQVERMLALGWGLSAAIGAVSGMLVAPAIYLEPNMMSGVLLYGFAAALLGGVDNPWGAVIAGFVVGVLENLLGAYVIGTQLKLTAALVMIIAVLIVRPAGIFGKATVNRV